MKKKQLTAHVAASMRMENMPLRQADKMRIARCLDGKSTFHQSVENLVKKHTQPNQSGK